jgi:hypothetical protein
MRPTVFILASGLALGAFASTGAAHAFPTVLGKPEAKAAAKGKAPPPAEVDKKVKLSPDGLRFGMTLEEISKLYEKVFDDEFVALYKTVEPGPRMAELDAELADKKSLIARNRLEFGTLPSGLDDTPLAGEFSYNNGETMTQVKLRSGVQRYFFFFGNHLWKVYDVHKLGKKSKLGADYAAATETLTKQFGKAPRALKAEPSEGRRHDQVDWQDKETVVRVLDRGDGSLALAYIDRKTEENLGRFRTNKPAHEEVDRDVAEITRTDVPKTDDSKKKK